MRFARLQAPAWLALVAMLLLAALPTAGRLFGDHQSSAALHAAMGHAPAPASVAPEAHAHHDHHDGHGGDADDTAPLPLPVDEPDCEYCPLYSGLLNSLAVPPLPTDHTPQVAWTVRALAVHHAAAPVPALGSQAPPSRS